MVEHLNMMTARPGAAESDLKVGALVECRTYFESAPHRLLRTFEKKKDHSVSGWKTNQFPGGFRFPKTFGRANDAIQFLDYFHLLVSEEARKSNHINQKEMCNLEC